MALSPSAQQSHPQRPVALVLRALGLGDLLTAVPALRAVRAALPEHTLVLATSEWLRPLVPLLNVVEKLHPCAELAPLRWSGASPDVAINLHGRGPQSHRVLMGVQPRRLVAFGCAEIGVAGPGWCPDEHEVRRWCRLIEAELNVPADPLDLSLRRPDVDPAIDGALVIHPGAAYSARRWPGERFAAVAAQLSLDGLPVVITGSAAERDNADQIRCLAGLPEDVVLAGRLPLDELAALVANARLVICGDTGVAHLAIAYDTPSVVLFGPTSPALWGPPSRPQHVVLWHGTGRGDPFADTIDPALDRISVGEVLAQARQLLRVDDDLT